MIGPGPGRSSLPPDTDTPVLAMTIALPRGERASREFVPTLRVVAGKDMLRFVSLVPGRSVTLGRDESCELSLDDASVSRKHARVACSERGDVEIEDLGSTNGTAVNGYPVKRSPLRTGDHVEIGAVALRLESLGTDEIGHLDRVCEKIRAGGCDALTGLKTRACLDDEVPALLAESDHSGRPLAAIFLDLDRFKSINDRFGHAVGDEVLRDVARLLLIGMRDSDLCIRYGGEEILVILPGVTGEQAAAIAERLRLRLAAHEWERTAEGLGVTASFGIAERAGGERIRDWFLRADRALYAAKDAGRNRVRLG